MVETIVGRPIDNFQSARRGGRFVAGPRSQFEPSELLYSDELEVNYFKAAEVMPPGWDGLDWLLGQGLIRRATKEDLNGWIAGAVPKGTPLDAKLWAKYKMAPSRTFVILGKIDLPNKLKWYGSYAFILPDGVPEPGYAKEAKIFVMKDFTCIPKSRVPTVMPKRKALLRPRGPVRLGDRPRRPHNGLRGFAGRHKRAFQVAAEFGRDFA